MNKADREKLKQAAHLIQLVRTSAVPDDEPSKCRTRIFRLHHQELSWEYPQTTKAKRPILRLVFHAQDGAILDAYRELRLALDTSAEHDLMSGYPTIVLGGDEALLRAWGKQFGEPVFREAQAMPLGTVIEVEEPTA